MNLSPQDRKAVLDLAATKIVADLRKLIDFEDLVTLPLDAVGQMVGLSSAHVARVMDTRPMGKRKKGVSLKTIKNYLKGES